MQAEIIYTVVIIESERGWGQRVEGTKEFKTKRGRDNFIKRFNSVNNEPTTPDWYMYAKAGDDVVRRARKRK